MNTANVPSAPAIHAPGAVQPGEVEIALAHVRAGGLLVVPSNERWTIIDARTLAKFERAGVPLLRQSKDGIGFRLTRGKSSVYLFPGQICYAIRKAS